MFMMNYLLVFVDCVVWVVVFVLFKYVVVLVDCRIGKLYMIFGILLVLMICEFVIVLQDLMCNCDLCLWDIFIECMDGKECC